MSVVRRFTAVLLVREVGRNVKPAGVGEETTHQQQLHAWRRKSVECQHGRSYQQTNKYTRHDATVAAAAFGGHAVCFSVCLHADHADNEKMVIERCEAWRGASALERFDENGECG